jgi:hypothetical protein
VHAATLKAISSTKLPPALASWFNMHYQHLHTKAPPKHIQPFISTSTSFITTYNSMKHSTPAMYLAEGPALCQCCKSCIIKVRVQAEVNLLYRRQYSSKGLHVLHIKPSVA